MKIFRFSLNSLPMSALTRGSTSYPAFSGAQAYANKRASMCIPNLGAIPVGAYYIFDRQTGGRLGRFRDALSGRQDWFALYAIDDEIDDMAYCEALIRSKFRLHPKSGTGRSEGCITVDDKRNYNHLHALLKSSPPARVSGSNLEAYGMVIVS